MVWLMSYMISNDNNRKEYKDAWAGMLAHQFRASWVSVCCKFLEMNLIIINYMKYAMCNIHITYYTKSFDYNDSSFILFHWDFTYKLRYDLTSTWAIFQSWEKSQ